MPSRTDTQWHCIVRFGRDSDTQGPLNGGVSNGGVSRSGLVFPFLSFLGLSRDFPDLLGMVRGFSRLVLFLFLGLLRAPTRNSPERVRDTIWTFPEKKWARVWKPPGLSSLKIRIRIVRCQRPAKHQKHKPCETKARVFLPFLLVGRKES